MRTLVGVLIELNHQNEQIIKSFLDKMEVCENKLGNSKLTLSGIIFGCQNYWLPSIKYLALALNLDHNLNALLNLYAALLPKLKVIRTFSKAMRSVPAFLGGLNLRSLEIETIAQSLHHLMSLCSSNTSIKLLLNTLIEHH